MDAAARELLLEELKVLKLAEQQETRERYARGELGEAERDGLFTGMPRPWLVGDPAW
ncbi:MAG: hypothetical protein IPN77_30015 [Sandaracinaceae bacterium]|nr:hypothetical protein [Sandaracinaceae bacterium]